MVDSGAIATGKKKSKRVSIWNHRARCAIKYGRVACVSAGLDPVWSQVLNRPTTNGVVSSKAPGEEWDPGTEENSVNSRREVASIPSLAGSGLSRARFTHGTRSRWEEGGEGKEVEVEMSRKTDGEWESMPESGTGSAARAEWVSNPELGASLQRRFRPGVQGFPEGLIGLLVSSALGRCRYLHELPGLLLSTEASQVEA